MAGRHVPHVAGGTDSRFSAETLLGALEADPAASLAAAALADEGEVFIVGGAIRDVLMGLPPKDVDLLARGIPGERVDQVLAGLPGQTKMTGRDFGVFRFSTRKAEVEIALPRLERSTGDGHTDFEVDYDHTLPIEEDLVRRDFTCNAIAFDLARGTLVDPYGGQSDIAAGVLRTVSPLSFQEDPLRILRGLRAHARHGLVPDADTRVQMASNADRLAHLSAERIGEEWEKLLRTGDPAAGMRLARETGVLQALISEAGPTLGPVAIVSEGALEAASAASPDPDLRAAAYLAGLETLRPGLTSAYLERIVWPKKRAQRIGHLHRMLKTPHAGEPLAARELLAELGKDEAEAFITLRATRAGAQGPAARAAGAEATQLRRVVEAREPTSLRELAVSGNDLIKAGVPAGPALGATLRFLLGQVIEEPGRNDEATLLALATRSEG